MKTELDLNDEVVALERAYYDRIDWEVQENANIDISYGGFVKFLLDKLLKKESVLLEYLPEKAVRMHFEGDIHIHKLPHSLYLPYCTGWSYKKLLLSGLVTPTMVSRPPKHADTAVSQLVSFFCTAAQEWTGAQAVSAFDLYLGAFVEHDRPSPKAVKQMLQRMLFDLNYPTRIGFQSAFTNITVLLDTNKQFLEEDAVVGGKIVGKLGDYLDEAVLVAKELFSLLIEGDALGQPFSFPIPTLMVTKNFDWEGSRWDGLTDLIFEALSKRGSAYLLNGNAAEVESLFSMCCRLTLDMEKVMNFELNSILEDVGEELRKSRGARGLWAVPDATGSIGVVTINLPRIGALSRGEWDNFISLLDERIDVAREVLRFWRGRYKQSLAKGLMPLTRRYLGHFNGHYSTVGLVGLPEAVANFLGRPSLWDELNRSEIEEAVALMKKMVAYVRKRVEEFEEEDGCLYNVEEVPAESAGTRLAILDREKFLKEFEAGEILIPGGDPAPYYSNSVIPYYASVPISLRAEWEGEVQREFTGGVIMHLFLNESPDPEALKKLARRIIENTDVIYFSFTPSISVCQKCDWHSVGVFDTCPKCGSNRIDVWSRIVGYYRPVRTWNAGKRAEFKNRATYGRESW
ncbi:MAG: anaerobic ribonucleoside-triphosphate reductase [Thermoproteota archaeon]|nr:MAG: anaerobic ribonucleoside-triphosphate reductase [Candidatus Korarchaeota archaeon]